MRMKLCPCVGAPIRRAGLVLEPVSVLVVHCRDRRVAAIRADEPEKLPPISERARKVHAAGMLFDGHNDLPWRLRTEGDFGLTKFDLSQRLDLGADRHSRGCAREA